MRRRTWLGLALVASSVGVAALDPRPTYVARAAAHQLALLADRVPLDAYHPPTEQARKNLARISDITRFAERELHLRTNGQYASVAPGRREPLWNVSACPPLSLRPETFWFPVTGRVPYLGFFDRPSADRRARAFERQGFDAWVRPAGTYSTLGWFADPLLPAMLDWPEERLVETLLHEWVHATVWVPGEVGFDESLASFVGERGATAWLRQRYGEGSAVVRQAEIEGADRDRYHAVLEQLAGELDALYTSPMDDESKLAAKRERFASLPARIEAAGLTDPLDYRAGADPSRWNNARLSQFRTYHRGYDAFERLTPASGGIGGLVDEVRGWPAGDPWATLEQRARSVAEF
ncbi:MAG: aminopeptidase [Myxococcota bacterium]